VNKAYKMYLGGAFVRSESGHSISVRGGRVPGSADPEVVNVPRGSRKDARDAVSAASAAAEPWARRTAYNRGQILYRLAEVMESRRAELEVSLVRGGETEEAASKELEVAIDRVVYYAGFCDKFQALIASSNPAAGPHFVFTVPEPIGVVGVLAAPRPALLGIVSSVLPAIAGGNACVALAGGEDPRTAVVWCECLATSDVPAGVVNVLTGLAGEVFPHIAKHREVGAMDIWCKDADLATALEREGAGNVKRTQVHDANDLASLGTERSQGLRFIESFLEAKTVWHPVGT
jgi:acyl-CoA reductase-like NAD-dependent aldehyde dehydrogenase